MSDTAALPRRRRRGALVFGDIEPIEIQEEMERSFLDYAMSVIIVARPARRARRPEARPPPDPLGHGAAGLPARPPVREVRPRHRRHDGQVPPARQTAPSTTPSCAWPSRSRCATRSSTSTATTARPTSARRPSATPSAACHPLAMRLLDGHRREHRRLHRRPTTAPPRSPSCCPPASPTCWSTAARASPSAWPPTSRPTTWARSSTPPSTSSTTPTPRPTT